MPRISPLFSATGLVAVLASFAACDGANSPSNTPPAAAFAPSCALLSCTFADGSSDADGQVTGYTWDFGDGAEATTQNSAHAYASAGTYVVELTVTDDRGATGQVSQPVTVPASQSGGLTANFTGSCAVAYHIGRILVFDCSFTDQSTAAAGTTVIAWAWSFGDGTRATVQNPILHHHALVSTSSAWPVALGVILNVTDNLGQTKRARKSVPIDTLSIGRTGGGVERVHETAYHGNTENNGTTTE